MLRASKGIPSGEMSRQDPGEEEWLMWSFKILLCGSASDPPPWPLYIHYNPYFVWMEAFLWELMKGLSFTSGLM